MKKKKKKTKVQHSDSFVPRYLRIPAYIAGDYRAGATIIELSWKYKAATTDIRKRLADLGVKIRRPGAQVGCKAISKLTPEQIKDILELDEQDMDHMAISKKYNVSRERIRQICLQAGHPTRRSRLVKSIQIEEARIARQIEHRKKIEQISARWRKGAHPDELSILLWGVIKPQMKTISRIAALRKAYGTELFPRRRDYHWRELTAVQRYNRMISMSNEWKRTADYNHIKKMFGFRTVESAAHAIASRRYHNPDLFPTIKQIIQNRTNDTSNNT